jgi:diguanylate cyclase (GGDEF)-like protein
VTSEAGAPAELMPPLDPPAERRPWSRLPLLWVRPADELAVPLLGRAGVIGRIRVAARPPIEETRAADELRMLQTFANHASVALENSRLVERLREEIAVREHEATHDMLTGLPNRMLFHRSVGDAIAARRPDEWLAVLLIDLDHFKAINDTLGHHVGDTVLARLAGAMAAALGPDEVIARLGGDDFAVLLTHLPSQAAALAGAERLRGLLARPVEVDGLQFEVAGSIGIALCPDDGTDSSTLLRRADVAMYLAKHQRSGAERYRLEQDPNTPRRLQLAGELRVATEQRQIIAHYQPKVALESGTVVGVEALARWEHPTHGLVCPDEFIPVAEQTGLIRPLTQCMLRTVLDQWRVWKARGHDLEVAVNLSTWSLLDGQIAEDVRELLADSGVPARALRLEITESGMMTDPRRTAVVLEQIDALGVGLSIDDFGTGYSSLSWLSRLPVDEVKIDRSFVHGLVASEGDRAIVRSTTDLGRSLGLTVVAEGVEDAATWEHLRALRCHAAQGYLLARPLPAAELLGWLAEHEACRRRPGEDGQRRAARIP